MLFRESGGSEKYTDAENLLKQRVAEIHSGRFTPGAGQIKVSELLDEVLADYEINGKSIGWARIVDGHLRPFFGNLAAAKVGSAAIARYAAERRAEGACNSTINREFTLLRRAFNLARNATPPRIAQAPKIPKLAEPPPRKGFFEDEVFVRMRAELPAHLKPVITFGYYTGCRKGEILSLRWDQVDLNEGIVRLEPGTTKNDEARTIPLPEELSQMLAMEKSRRDREHSDCPWVFSKRGRRIKCFRGAWEEAAKRADLVDSDGRPLRLFHDLRRTGVRNLVRAGVPERVAMMISGHKSRSVFDRYNIVSERDLREAASRLSRYLADQAQRGLAPPSSAPDHQRPSRQPISLYPTTGPLAW